jgi:hypothetical protein
MMTSFFYSSVAVFRHGPPMASLKIREEGENLGK